jgi:hypothetical protein
MARRAPSQQAGIDCAAAGGYRLGLGEFAHAGLEDALQRATGVGLAAVGQGILIQRREVAARPEDAFEFLGLHARRGW